ncbi:ParB/RepB/Spo0J family partition protein [Planktotalea frisia]|jgi:ParB family chromosome partitioning protein|uniref:Chromosome-partitioning protein ParB n=1 Tax=Planktotalea frisia TaxID=696762 RepID=A0A1L9NUB8_9RHOB|nr:ParB N-terminal domain-containing protein [Planktotalea frisia]OJI92839.1 chromosome-partitioning protein ParB [Planktotalea frisia]PZX25200.1 ParB/RepB/Spo0J family partition protein [Planktotalea frisia]
MARKRKLDAGLPPLEEEVSVAPKPAMGGMWAGSAMNLLKQRIEDTHGSLVSGILNGTVALTLDPAQIIDQTGSDRIGDWQGDVAFDALKANIARRGQTQPIRVRAVEPNWQPNADTPLQTDAQFAVQSGRRRVEACRQLGLPVLAILSTDQGDAALADLEERFHENTMRKDLNGFEELLSIGLLAESLSDHTQEDIAERLSVSQGDVSLGLACVSLREKIVAEVDIEATPKRAYRAIIPKLKRGAKAAPKPKPIDRSGASKRDDISVDIKSAKGGVTLIAKGQGLEAIDPQEVADDFAQYLFERRKFLRD